MKICFASNNQHKLKEISSALHGSGIELLDLHDIGCFEELPETQDTLEGNALQKANFVLEHYKIPCFADDTGLEVAALNGAPGVYSARYAGPQRSSVDNIKLLLQNLEASADRKARFRTIVALVGFNPEPILFEGEISGEIASEPSGEAGFGYDPVFIPQGHIRTFAEMSLEEKNTMSHRALAVRKLTTFLRNHTPSI